MTRNKYTQTRVKRQKPKKKLRKGVFFTFIFVLIAFLSVAGYATYLYVKADTALSGSFDDEGREKSDLRETVVDPKFDNVSILVMGVDENEKRDNAGNSRTDTLMLATLNKDEKSVKMLSIPRDTLVYLPEAGYETKINHAHAFGGPKSTMDAAENLLDIPVDYYVKVNFEAFVEVVDAINGIEVEVPYEFKESNSKDKRDAIHLMEGIQTLNGEEALALARTRKKDNDIERGKRQLEIVKAAINKATSISSVLKYDDMIEAVGDNMATTLKFEEMKSLVAYGTSKKGLDIESLTLDGIDYQPSGTYYWKVDQASLAETQSILKEHLELVDTSTETPVEESDPYSEPDQPVDDSLDDNYEY